MGMSAATFFKWIPKWGASQFWMGPVTSFKHIFYKAELPDYQINI
jgi:hypothetical protein